MSSVDLEDPSRPGDPIATDDAVESPSNEQLPPSPLRVLLESLPFAAVAIGVAAWIYRLWDQDWSLPFRSFGPDVYFIESTLKAIQDHGWYLTNPQLNAPFGQQTYDYPNAGENLQLGIIKLFTLITRTPGQALNLYYLVGFGLLVMVTFAVFRHLRFGAIPAGAAALLYTFLPYHFWHMEDHLFRSTYLSAPIAALLLLWGLSWRTTFLRDPDGATWGVRRLAGNLKVKWVVAALLLCGVVATFETMTIAFFLTTFTLAAIIVAIRRRDPGQLAVLGVAIATCGLAFALSLAPNLRYWAANGTNKDTGRRVPTEQEAFGLQPSQLLLPIPTHRIHALRGLQKTARRNSSLPDEGGQELGLVGAVGLLTLLYWALSGGVRRRVREPFHDRGMLREHASLATLILIPVGTVSGFALLLSISGFAQVRVWNRVVVLIGFFAMMAVAMGFEKLLARRQTGSFWRSKPVAIGAIALITVFGLWDTGATRNANYGNRANITELKPFLASTQKLLPAHGAVFQLPITPFPETPAKGSTQEYDQLLPYLWSNNGLRWSAGGMRGRPDADWQLQVFADGPVKWLAALRGLGFDAILLDTHGYDDDGKAAVADLTAALGKPQLTSANGRWLLWDIRPWAERTGLTDAEARAAARRLVGDDIDRVPGNQP